MTLRRFRLAVLGATAVGLTALVAATATAPSRRVHRKSPHVQVAATAIVESEPRRTVHKNRREFLEFEVKLTEARKEPDAAAHDTPDLELTTDGPVKVLHDLSCGGSAIELKQGDTVELKGEYVKPRKGGDLIHFTHAADGSCGTKGGHPDGYLRKAPVASAGG